MPSGPSSLGLAPRAGSRRQGLVSDEAAVTTVLVSRARFLSVHTDIVRRFVAAHRELNDWIRQHPEEAQGMVGAELKTRFRMELAPHVIAHAGRA